MTSKGLSYSEGKPLIHKKMSPVRSNSSPLTKTKTGETLETFLSTTIISKNTEEKKSMFDKLVVDEGENAILIFINNLEVNGYLQQFHCEPMQSHICSQENHFFDIPEHTFCCKMVEDSTIVFKYKWNNRILCLVHQNGPVVIYDYSKKPNNVICYETIEEAKKYLRDLF